MSNLRTLTLSCFSFLCGRFYARCEEGVWPFPPGNVWLIFGAAAGLVPQLILMCLPRSTFQTEKPKSRN